MKIIYNSKSLITLAFTLVLFLTGCRYHLGYGNLTERYQTFSIAYVEGDQTGELTAHIIQKMSTSSGLKYANHGGDLTLEVKIIDLSDENIGFRYDQKKRDKLKKAIMPSETRLKAILEVKILEAGSCSLIRGPARLTASVDFDHTYYTTRHEINRFSLGQLNNYDAALDAVKHPLYRTIAERVVDFVNNSW